MVPASAGMLDDKSVTSAVVGPSTLVLKLPGRNVSILHGKLMGLIIALVLSGRRPNSANPGCLFTDHLNSVRLISDSQTNVSQLP
jgi:hypothetical protein